MIRTGLWILGIMMGLAMWVPGMGLIFIDKDEGHYLFGLFFCFIALGGNLVLLGIARKSLYDPR